MEEIANPSQLITPQSQQPVTLVQNAAPIPPPSVINPETKPNHSSRKWLIIIGVVLVTLLISSLPLL
jgi:hypothetical protein